MDCTTGCHLFNMNILNAKIAVLPNIRRFTLERVIMYAEITLC